MAQKTGIVLSGGGASGLAHIGVLKALEENEIPIDYITGTSMGALVGALYSSGLSPGEIEAIVTSEEFNHYVNGIIDEKYSYYFKQKEANSSWITLRFSPDAVQTSLPTNLISTIPIDLALMQMFSGPAAISNYNFDSLFIPFRCVASDIVNKKQITFSSGNLNEAVRASMTYPFYLKPITVEGKLLFDGGLYNNFPSDVMYNHFYPDIIIGSNVSSNFPLPDEDDILSQVKNMVAVITNYNTLCDNGVMIEAHSDVSAFDFESPQTIIDIGYQAALLQIDEIKGRVSKRCNKDSLRVKRKEFREQLPELKIGTIKINGLGKKQSLYITKLLQKKEQEISFNSLKSQYYRLITDDKIKSIFPVAIYNPARKNYELQLRIKKEKEVITQFGGNISNKPINQGFVGIQYNYLGKAALTLTGNTYFGKLYGSVQAKGRIDFPNKIPFYVETGYTLNRWDFFKSSSAFFEDVKPSYLIQSENYGNITLGVPVFNHGKLNGGISFANLQNDYYQTRLFSVADTADITNFNMITYYGTYENSTLDKKQYASKGHHFAIKGRYIKGEEFTKPGSTSVNEYPFRGIHEWIQFSIAGEKYFMPGNFYKTGIYAEAVYSTQPFFHNYTATVLSSPAFAPIPESKTIFLEHFRATQYMAFGYRNIFSFPKNIDLRIEGYIFQPLKEILKDENLVPYYDRIFTKRYLIASSTLVFHSPLGPLAASLNYYQGQTEQLSFMLHFGYILFNKRALE